MPLCDLTTIVEWFSDRDSAILFHGGGNWGDIWSPHLTRLDMASELVRSGLRRFVSLPQSIYYYDDTRQVGMQRDADKLEEWAAAGANFTLFWRQHDSMAAASQYYAHAHNVLTPDAAWAIGPVYRTASAKVDVLILLRKDKETVPSHEELVQGALEVLEQSEGVTYAVTDWFDAENPQLSGAHGLHVSELLLTKGVDMLSQGRVVVTNRLHATILATLMHMPVFYVDNMYGKIRLTRQASLSHPSCTDETLQAWHFDDIFSAVDAAIAWAKEHPVHVNA